MTEFLVDARNAGYYVDALVLDEQRGEDDPGDSDSDALGLYIANRAIEAGLRGGWPQPVVSADTLIGLATRARILIAEVFEGRRKPANKILGFMLKDLKHLVSVHIATFAVDSKMTSATLDALVGKAPASKRATASAGQGGSAKVCRCRRYCRRRAWSATAARVEQRRALGADACHAYQGIARRDSSMVGASIKLLQLQHGR